MYNYICVESPVGMLTLAEEDGALTVIDYKTDAVRTEEELAARAEYYAGQLRTYAAALRRITGKPVKECLLYFLAVDEIVAVEI